MFNRYVFNRYICSNYLQVGERAFVLQPITTIVIDLANCTFYYNPILMIIINTNHIIIIEKMTHFGDSFR